MMMKTNFSLSADNFKSILSKYFDFDISDFYTLIDTDGLDNVLKLWSRQPKGIDMTFSNDQIKDILIDLFNKDTTDTKIDNIHVIIINNRKKNRKYISIDCDISKECLESIVDIISK